MGRRPGTVRLLVVLTGLLALYGCAAPADKFQVFDATGKPVGSVLHPDIATVPIVALVEADSGSALRVWQDRLGADGALYYESSDCSGAAFFDALSVVTPGHLSTRLASTAIGAPGRTVYVAATYSPTRTLLVGTFSFNERCYFASSFEKTVVPARPVTDLNTQYTPPFTIRHVIPNAPTVRESAETTS